MESLFNQINNRQWRWLILIGLAGLTFVSVWFALRMRINLLFAVPIAVVGGLQIIYNYKPIFYALFFSIPLSMQLEMGPLALELVSEPLMIILLLIFVINLLSGKQFHLGRRIRVFHVFVFLLIFWTGFTTLMSEFPLRSLKFLLSKLWYLAAIVYTGEHIINRPLEVKRLFWLFFVSLVLVAFGITVRHALVGFAFEESNGIAFPLFANGVIYAATLVLFLPWCWYARTWYTPRSLEWYLIIIGTAILVIATIFTYKRGAWAALLLLPFIDFMIRGKVFDKFVYAVIFVVVLALGYLIQDNRFYAFAPNYQKTIWHEGDISGHLSATLSGTEISSMERFYRWVAAKNMIADNPLLGSGPSTFNQVYKRYTDDAFRTYVSDNPEQSTTHNYFLMTFAEQGFPGGLLFIAMCLYMLLKAARLRGEISDPLRRSILMMATLSLCTILFHSLLNELIEVDKIGTMFWLCLVLIHKSEVWHEQDG
ncbi:MAG: O-antigen ligase family protein [Bacteroidota bacterium]